MQVAASPRALRNFRSYERAEVALGPGITVVAGRNGAGKSNLLEAIYFACTGRSCRTSNERECVRFGAGVLRLELDAQGRDGVHELTVGLPARARPSASRSTARRSSGWRTRPCGRWSPCSCPTGSSSSPGRRRCGARTSTRS